MTIYRREGKFVRLPVSFVERMAELSNYSVVMYLAIRLRAGIHSETVPASFAADFHGKGLLELTGLSRSRAYLALKELQKFGLIQKTSAGIEIKMSNESIQPSPAGGTENPAGGTEKYTYSPAGGTKNPAGGTNRPAGGTNRPAGGIPSSINLSENENEKESAGASSRHPLECNEIKSYTSSPSPRDFLVWYSNQYETRIGQPYQIAWKKDSAIVSRLMETYGPEVLGEMAEELLTTGDEWIREKMGRSIQALVKFSAKWSELVQSKRNKKAAAERNGNGTYTDREKRIRRERVQKEIQALEEKYGPERAKLLHADRYDFAASLE